jgi:hypothetical protein
MNGDLTRAADNHKTIKPCYQFQHINKLQTYKMSFSRMFIQCYGTDLPRNLKLLTLDQRTAKHPCWKQNIILLDQCVAERGIADVTVTHSGWLAYLFQ